MDGWRVCGAVLYDELVEKILSWLPVKYLIRFKCMCKSWNSLMAWVTLVGETLDNMTFQISKDQIHLKLYVSLKSHNDKRLGGPIEMGTWMHDIIWRETNVKCKVWESGRGADWFLENGGNTVFIKGLILAKGGGEAICGCTKKPDEVRRLTLLTGEGGPKNKFFYHLGRSLVAMIF
ncbi:hypothetical protein CR513_50427, partial [Mucuna pruriens]